MSQTTTRLPGGTIVPEGTYRTADGARPMWRATSSHTGESILCYSRGLAEFYVWIVNETYASRQMRGVA